MWRAARLLVLLAILAATALGAGLNHWRAQSWSRPQVLTLYPLAADGGADTQAYLETLDERAFAQLAPWFQAQAAAHGLSLETPLRVVLGRRILSQPPALPQDGSPLSAIRWSLQMRWWAWRHTPPSSPVPDIKLYLMFHGAASEGPLPHSVGLPQGRLGLVHLFASRPQQGPNLVVVAHELLHTFGATDKYDPSTLLPQWPQGYAQPGEAPHWPQHQAEVMGGRLPLSATEARMPHQLSETVVGPQTAAEIGWRQP